MKKIIFCSALVCYVCKSQTHEAVFTHIYDVGHWGRDQFGRGISGVGSLLINAKEYIGFVQKFLQNHNIRSVVDAGCGDWTMSKHIHWGHVNYIGYDVVRSVIERNNCLYKKRGIVFIKANFLDIDLPSADLLLCKDVLQHLTNEDILKFLKKISQFKYCLFTNEIESHTLSSENRDIVIGSIRPIDLSKPPFSVDGRVVLIYRTREPVIKQIFLIENDKFDR